MMHSPWLRVHVRSWQAVYRTLLPDDGLDQLRPEDRAQKYDFATLDPLKPRTIVAVEEGMIHGFATTSPIARSGTAGPWRAVCALCGSHTVGPGYWHGPGFSRTCQPFWIRISQCGPVGARGQCSRGPLLSDRPLGGRWPAPNPVIVGCNGQRNSLPARTLSR